MGQPSAPRSRHDAAGPDQPLLQSLSAPHRRVLQATGRGGLAMNSSGPLVGSPIRGAILALFLLAAPSAAIAQEDPALQPPPVPPPVQPVPGEEPPAPAEPAQPAEPSEPAAAPDENPLDVEDRGAQNNPTAGEMNEELTRAVRLGLEYLQKQQNSDGSFGRDQ